MRRRSDRAADALFRKLVNLPWWIGPACAAVVYVALKFIVPAVVSAASDSNNPASRTFNAVLLPIIAGSAPWIALFVLFIWVLAELQKRRSRRGLDRQTGLDSIREMSWKQFEELLAEAYRRQGYEVERTGDAPGGDGGVDLVLRRSGQTTLVQCKHWKSWSVGVRVIRELRGVMTSENAGHGVVVSSGTFTAAAEEFARENDIALVGGSELARLVLSVRKCAAAAPLEAVPVAAGVGVAAQRRVTNDPAREPAISHAAPACPRCGSAMVRRTARRGTNAGKQFWGCSSWPACQGTRPD